MPMVSSASRAVVGRGVGALAAVDGDGSAAGEVDAGGRRVVAAERGGGDVVERRLAAGHAHLRRLARRRRRCAPSELTSTSSAPSVPLAMTVSAEASPVPSNASRSTSTLSRSVPVRSLTVTVSAPPSVADVERLDAVEVHRDRGDVAGEPHARAVGRDVDVLADVGAVEVHARRCRPGPRRCRCRRPDPTGTCRRRLPSRAVSAPRLPSTKSLPVPPMSMSSPSPPTSVSLPAPPSMREARRAARCRCCRSDHVVAAAGLHVDGREGAASKLKCGRRRDVTERVGRRRR